MHRRHPLQFLQKFIPGRGVAMQPDVQLVGALTRYAIPCATSLDQGAIRSCVRCCFCKFLRHLMNLRQRQIARALPLASSRAETQNHAQREK